MVFRLTNYSKVYRVSKKNLSLFRNQFRCKEKSLFYLEAIKSKKKIYISIYIIIYRIIFSSFEYNRMGQKVEYKNNQFCLPASSMLLFGQYFGRHNN